MAMQQLRLRPMSAAEFGSYRARLIPAYAADHVQAGTWEAGQAETMAARQVDELLPGATRTAGMLLLMAENAAGPVGLVWIALDRDRHGDAWIYDIEVSLQQRGQGLGRALLQAAEREARRHGATSIGLHVFGANTVARRLYESAGYQTTSLIMHKPLAAG